jgi:hypothetical protein
MSPIKLSDDELSAVLAAARPLDVRVRDAFLQQVASELARCDEVGPGVVHRVSVPPLSARSSTRRTSAATHSVPRGAFASPLRG